MTGDYMSTAWVDSTEAAHVLWDYGEGGTEPGPFVKRLLDTIAHADYANRSKLGLAYPGYVAACNIIERDKEGVAILTEIMAVARREAEGEVGQKW